MTVGDFIKQATQTLSVASIESARLDCLILLEDVLHTDRAYLLAHPEATLSSKTEVELNTKIAQRAQHMPLAYIRGAAPFYGRLFTVNKHVLIPRPETETMTSLLKTLHLAPQPRIADIGTGSGCLGITAALEIKNAEVYLLDIDKQTLAVAKQNAATHHAKVTLLQSDLLQHLPASCNILLANLPYVPINYPINKAAGHEPKLALFAGSDGLELYRRFWQEIKTVSPLPQIVLTESLSEQHEEMAKFALAAGYRLSTSTGLIQCFLAS